MSLVTAVPVKASTFYTIDAAGELTNGETVVIAGKTYTAQATLTDSERRSLTRWPTGSPQSISRTRESLRLARGPTTLRP